MHIYEVTDLVPASRPAGAAEDWWQMQTVLWTYEAADEDEMVANFDGEEADLNVYGRAGYALIATRKTDGGALALWAIK